MNKKEWVRGWVERDNRDKNLGLTPREIDKAATIGEAVFSGNVGVGRAAEAGIEAVKKLRE